jgi:hypothetical protein
MRLAKTGQGVTRTYPQWGCAMGAMITRHIDGCTDLAFAKPGTRSTTILCDNDSPIAQFARGFRPQIKTSLRQNMSLDMRKFNKTPTAFTRSIDTYFAGGLARM